MLRVPHKFPPFPPFLPHLRQPLVVTAFVQQDLRYYRRIRLLLIVHVQIMDSPSCTVQTPPLEARKSGDLTAPAQEASTHAGFFDAAGSHHGLPCRHAKCCFPLVQRRQHPRTRISTLNFRPACAAVNASRSTSRLLTHDSRSVWLAKPSLQEFFLPYLLTVCAVALYASAWSSPSTPQHSLISGRYPLPMPDFHQLEHASFAWRTKIKKLPVSSKWQTKSLLRQNTFL